jgi:hypothetical protein
MHTDQERRSTWKALCRSSVLWATYHLFCLDSQPNGVALDLLARKMHDVSRPSTMTRDEAEALYKNASPFQKTIFEAMWKSTEEQIGLICAVFPQEAEAFLIYTDAPCPPLHGPNLYHMVEDAEGEAVGN